ncbi:MAG: sigma-70 family RNA polymerase sigma factor [candidate division KSB1 bacterium]|nr:sigma-70 family RNA polymerase sigma factor [candidate division KSB1 bacterium]MDZ7317638.1 sigma-70 family RNA polymerase sigma factor [candidate division KSB1 bacterium]MDZ7341665.1 sigma-70 family RNA polymerase sigma factor [candidate division KSB1 bacterium]
MRTDKDLIENILAGQTDCFAEIIQKYQRLVSHIVFRMIPGSADREDICQEIFLLVYQHLSTFKFESKLSTWIGRIAYNHCLNFLAKKKIPLWEDLLAEDQFIETPSATDHSPEERLSRQDQSERLQHEIEQLPPPWRTILTLYHGDELKYHEISRIMGMPEGTVKSYLFRARKLLKERLTAKYRLEELSV